MLAFNANKFKSLNSVCISSLRYFMLLFSQDYSPHSRIGNSLMWMVKQDYFIKEINQDFLFPYAIEAFGSYLSDTSSWMKDKKEIRELFSHYFNSELTSNNLRSESRNIQARFETEKKINAFEWVSIETSLFDGEVYYVAGKFDCTSDVFLKNVLSHKLTIIVEPFSFLYEKNPILSGRNYNEFTPKKELLEYAAEAIKLGSAEGRNVGFHVRRGDYKIWKDGLYYFSDDFWVEKIEACKLAGDTPWVFMNTIEPEFLKKIELLDCKFASESFEKDFTLMMFMDCIYGPPSTFSYMASSIANNNLRRKSDIAFFDPMSAD